MIIVLKILHLLALVFGSIASLGNIYLGFAKGPHDLAAPDYTNMLRKLYRRTGLGAIVVLWVTGLLMMIGKYGVWVPGFAFNAKITFALILTAIVLFTNLMAARLGTQRWPAFLSAGTYLDQLYQPAAGGGVCRGGVWLESTLLRAVYLVCGTPQD